MKVVSSPRYAIDIGPHVFPTEKYRRIYDRLLATPRPGLEGIIAPQAAAWDELALVHTAEYLEKVRTLCLSSEEIVELQLPLNEPIVEGFRLMTGGTLTAARLGLADGLACHVGGGFHHAFANHGEGFCLFNDVVVAVEVLRQEGAVSRVAVVDLDVHHGSGTALIYARDPAVFTFSIHEQHNYPAFKPRGSLDIGLAAGTDDATYLARLEVVLPQVVAHEPDLMVYLAGADPFEDDQLGNLKLSKEGLRKRDRLVLRTMRGAGVPVAIVLAGGYARQLVDTVDIHVATIEEALTTCR
ncbi:MAG: histone deacetylase [Acidobacteriota bacterium]|nr:histone deacetylase [Acidobacteriota bacterium]